MKTKLDNVFKAVLLPRILTGEMKRGGERSGIAVGVGGNGKVATMNNIVGVKMDRWLCVTITNARCNGFIMSVLD